MLNATVSLVMGQIPRSTEHFSNQFTKHGSSTYTIRLTCYTQAAFCLLILCNLSMYDLKCI